MTEKEITNQIKAAYNGIAELYQDAYAEADEYDLKYVEQFSNRLSGRRVIDLGCGTGTIAGYLTRLGFDVLGIDYSENMLTIARNNYPKNQFKNMSILDLPSDLGKFDGIVLSYVANHFTHKMLNALKPILNSLLSEKGIIFIAAHVGNEEMIVTDPLDENIQLYYHFLSTEELDGLLSEYDRIYTATRASFGEEEFLCDKMFVIYRKR